METKVMSLGGELVDRAGFGAGCPHALCPWRSDSRRGWGRTPEVNPPYCCSCENSEELGVFVHPCHLAWCELGLRMQKASLYDFSEMQCLKYVLQRRGKM